MSKNDETPNVNDENFTNGKTKNDGIEYDNKFHKELREVELKRFMGSNNHTEPKEGLLTDDEVLKYVPESIAAQKIRLKRIKNGSFRFFGGNYIIGIFGMILRTVSILSLIYLMLNR
ncbi:MAG: hypothetical protein LBV42_01560 [Methanobrevibacter sp.]|jgi:hypothetical protein|nr:hypothetical protein [Methanobrevibacter sp.]